MTRGEVTGEFQPNMSVDVVIATAGSGARMASVTPGLHKGLLPFRDAPIIWGIVNQIPLDLNLAFIVGHLSDQVKNFCELAITNRAISFIEVDDWKSAKAGTSHSLLCAEASLNAGFWYVPCDGVFDGELFERRPVETTYFVKEVAAHETENYQTFDLSDDGRIRAAYFKKPLKATAPAFTGVMWIEDKQEFFDGLRESESTEFAESIRRGSKTEILDSWIDLGNPLAYHRALEKEREYDFTKPDELTFVLQNQVIKWFKNPATVEAKLVKPLENPSVYPSKVMSRGEFLSYEKVEGNSIYGGISPRVFERLLKWLRKNLWRESREDISDSCELFYRQKTFSRIERMRSALATAPYQFCSVDGIPVLPWLDYVREIPFDALALSAVSSEIHGDLQFDNIIEESGTGDFILIDWRPSFGNETLVGDLYYDLGKLLGGIRLDYSEVKRNGFEIKDVDRGVSLEVPVSRHGEELENILRVEVGKMGLDFSRVELLVPLIYLNMAPLHTEPFARFLWALALKRFALLK